MAKEILVNVGERETRIAVVEDGRPVELHIEREERVVGSLYKARVCNVLPGMDAAFVDISLERNAFLYVGDVLPQADALSSRLRTGDAETASDIADDEEDIESEKPSGEEMVLDSLGGAEADIPCGSTPASLHEREAGEPSSAGRRPGRRRSISRSVLRHQNIRDVLKVGQELLVQVIKGPRGTKGARVSTRITLPGRYLVLMPDADNVGVSRKIEDPKERERLKRIGANLREPGFGIIIRTEAEEKTEQELRADLDFLLKLWRQIQDTYRRVKAPALVHADLTLVNKTIRDIFGSDVTRLVIDDPEEYEKANELLDMVSPKLRGRIHLYSGEEPIFDHYKIQPEIERLLKRKVWLRSGGTLVFDETEALTVIDVNTGKFVGGSNLSETILKTNLDAAAEIARQLRLRDIGGIIVIDFIDMSNPRDRQQVLRALEVALKKDRSRTKISGISGLGLVEMTRKRTGETITAFLSEMCPVCQGRGKLSSAETVSIELERELQRVAGKAGSDKLALFATCHPDVAELLVGPDGDTVDRVEQEIERAIYVRAKADAHLEHFEVMAGNPDEFDKQFGVYRRAQVVDCRVARSLASPDAGAVAWADGYLIQLRGDKASLQRYLGQMVKVKILEVRRSFALGTVVPGSSRPLDRSQIL
ncbi:MAG: Rne/Rng family ribonuclease [Chthonomonadales bacterium]